MPLVFPKSVWASEPEISLYHSESLGPQLIFACSKSTIETLEKGVKHVQS